MNSDLGGRLLKTNSDSTAVLSNSMSILNETSIRGFDKLSGLLINQLQLAAAMRVDSKEQYADMIRNMAEAKLEAGVPQVIPDKDDKDKDDPIEIGGLFTILAIAIGAFAGVIMGQVKAIVAFAKALTPRKIQKMISSVFKSLKGLGSSLKANIMKQVGGVGSKVASVFDDVAKKLKSLFSVDKSSKIGKIIRAIKSGFSSLTKPFIDLWEMLKGFKSGGMSKIGGTISKVFGVIKKTMGSFGGIITKVAPMMSKLFAPVAIIMGIVDAVQGAMAGFEKDGILGGVVGAITGLLDGLIAKPLDLLKDMISWIAEKLGFENFSKSLDSFSFSDLTGDIYEKIVGLPGAMLQLLKDAVKSFLPDPGSLAANLIPDAIYEFVNTPVPQPEKLEMSEADKALQHNASGVADRNMEGKDDPNAAEKQKNDIIAKLKEGGKASLTKEEQAQWRMIQLRANEEGKKQLKGKGIKLIKPVQKEAPAMTATKHNQQIKQNAENLKDQNKAIQVNAPQVMSDNSSSNTVNNLAAEATRNPNSRI